MKHADAAQIAHVQIEQHDVRRIERGLRDCIARIARRSDARVPFALQDTLEQSNGGGLIIASQNFDDPNVLVMMTLANTVGMVLLMLVARRYRLDNAAGAATT